MAKPRFSVVVPTRNRPEMLAACLQSFCQLEFPDDDWELIVVNDGGEESFTAVSPQHHQTLPLKLLEISPSGPAVARNRGANAAKFEHLAFTDDDCRVMPDWLQQFARGFAQTGCDGLGGGTDNPQPDNVAMRASQFLIEFMYGFMQDEANNNLMLVSNNVAYQKDVFTAVHGFNESFPLAAGEDMELGFRVVANGYRQQYWPAAQVAHYHDLSCWGHVRQQFRYGRGGHFFLQAVAEQARNGLTVQPGSAKNFYRALGEAVRQQEEPLSFSALVTVAQAAYRFGQFYQRQLSRF
ncbi:MAG: glycosyltransferase [Chloroflexi bacterium]|nr:glycosyltransferase [Chloroflexota bacterium]